MTTSARGRCLTAAILAVVAATACARRPLPVAPEADAGGRPDARDARDALDARDATDAAAFQAVAPCPTAADYATGTNTVVFGFLGTPPGFSYDPKCLAIDAGASVTFSGNFAAHSLYPSARRGTTANNPIGGVASGDSKVVQFPTRGFFAYYCGIHGGADDGTTMAGVIWVK